MNLVIFKFSNFQIFKLPPVKENFPLKTYNTFGISATARYFSSFASIEELDGLLSINQPTGTPGKLPLLILGGGSNILFTGNFDGLVLKNNILGIEKVREDADHIYVKAGAGVNWHQLVVYCIENNLAGVENLSLIPGNTGASPMQNIGAYGVEIKDVFFELEAFHVYEKTTVTFNLYECEFGYLFQFISHAGYYKFVFVFTFKNAVAVAKFTFC